MGFLAIAFSISGVNNITCAIQPTKHISAFHAFGKGLFTSFRVVSKFQADIVEVWYVRVVIKPLMSNITQVFPF